MSARTKEQTRQLMLETGKELLQERGVPEEIPIKLSDVLARLRLTTGAAYHIWDSQDAYRRDLTLFVAQTLTPDAIPDLHQLVEECNTGDFHTTVSASAKRYLESYINGDVYLRLYFWAIKSPSAEVAEATEQAYTANSSFPMLCQEAIRHCDRRIVGTLDAQEVDAATLALLDGFSLRLRFDGDGGRQASFDAFGSAVAHYLGAVTEPA